MSGGATPRMEPRPEYPPAHPIFRAAVVRTFRWTLFTTAFACGTAPLYRSSYECFVRSGVKPPERVTHLAPWVTPDDLWFTCGLSSSITLIYLLYNGFFFACDHWKLFQRYKMPRKPSQEPSAALVAATLRKEAFAHTITAPLIMLVLAGPLFRHSGGGRAATVDPASIPSALEMWGQFTFAFLLNENLFYWGHRLLHTRAFYAAVHKQHHQYIGTRSFAAEYAHMFEDVLTAYMPYLAGLLLTRAHYHVVFVWFFCRLTETYEAHSGYCMANSIFGRLGLSQSQQAIFHDHHHTVNLGSFGWEVLDYLFGTMDHWVAGGGAAGYLGHPSEQGYMGKQS
mmetsp:Transcript_7901/g.20654  ORF Transcript_7901/g.20654 Transcript_7901/m.20654 type:complete len:339 (-) Transcript_7901:188-1204(-)